MQSSQVQAAEATIETPFRGWYESSQDLRSGLTVRELDPALNALFFRLLGSERGERVVSTH